MTADVSKAYESLNSVRDRVLHLAPAHILRVRYRDLRRGLANFDEDVRATGRSTADIASLCATIERFVDEFNAACEAGVYIDRKGRAHETVPFYRVKVDGQWKTVTIPEV